MAGSEEAPHEHAWEPQKSELLATIESLKRQLSAVARGEGTAAQMCVAPDYDPPGPTTSQIEFQCDQVFYEAEVERVLT